jgi:alkylation response protein AidB-like acyl-CoA dehydrogenase
VADAETVRRGGPALVPWAPAADVFLLADAQTRRVYRAIAVDTVLAVETLGAEPWGRVTLEAGELLEGGARALASFDLLIAGWLAAAGKSLVEAAAEHARRRSQFGRAIGEFQAVAHPLADAHMALAAAATLARAAACALDESGSRETAPTDGAAAWASAARISAREASLRAVHTAHQTFGAIGITLDGPIYHISRRVRQLASHPVGAAGAAERVASLLSSSGLDTRAGLTASVAAAADANPAEDVTA